jgi:hypothetical protein
MGECKEPEGPVPPERWVCGGEVQREVGKGGRVHCGQAAGGGQGGGTRWYRNRPPGARGRGPTIDRRGRAAQRRAHNTRRGKKYRPRRAGPRGGVSGVGGPHNGGGRRVRDNREINLGTRREGPRRRTKGQMNYQEPYSIQRARVREARLTAAHSRDVGPGGAEGTGRHPKGPTAGPGGGLKREGREVRRV